jgi:hypothetical protein
MIGHKNKTCVRFDKLQLGKPPRITETEAMNRHAVAKPVSGTTLPRWCLSIVPNVPPRRGEACRYAPSQLRRVPLEALLIFDM